MRAKGLIVATVLGAGLLAAGPTAAHGPRGYDMMGPGMMSPGMMGPGHGYGYGYGPGMGACPWMMGPGMMGPGMMGPGMMGPGMMGPGYGYGPGMGGGMMMGPGMGGGPGMGMGPGMMGRSADRDLSTEDIRQRLERHLAMQGNPRLKVGDVKQKDDDTIVADIVTQDGSLVSRYEIDRHNGLMRPTN